MMKDDYFKLLRGFDNERTFVIVESLSRLKREFCVSRFCNTAVLIRVEYFVSVCLFDFSIKSRGCFEIHKTSRFQNCP